MSVETSTDALPKIWPNDLKTAEQTILATSQLNHQGDSTLLAHNFRNKWQNAVIQAYQTLVVLHLYRKRSTHARVAIPACKFFI